MPERKMFLSDEAYQEELWQWNNDPLYGWCRKNKKPDGSNYNLYRDGLKIYRITSYNVCYTKLLRPC